MPAKDFINFLRDFNDIVRLVTGISIPGIAKRGAELLGKDAARKLKEIVDEKPPPPDSPYAALGVRESASTTVIRATYIDMTMRMKHNTEEYQKIHQAYMEILAQRGEG